MLLLADAQTAAARTVQGRSTDTANDFYMLSSPFVIGRDSRDFSCGVPAQAAESVQGQVRCRNSNNIKHNIAHVQVRRTIFLEKLKRFAACRQARKSGRGIIRGRCTGALKLVI